MFAHISISNVRPISKQTGTHYGKGHAWLSQEYKNFKEIVAWEAKIQLPKYEWEMNTDRKIAVRTLITWPEKNPAKNRIGDIADNVVSGILDALQGVAYKNDRQIYKSEVEKISLGQVKGIFIVLTMAI